MQFHTFSHFITPEEKRVFENNHRHFEYNFTRDNSYSLPRITIIIIFIYDKWLQQMVKKEKLVSFFFDANKRRENRDKGKTEASLRLREILSSIRNASLVLIVIPQTK